MHYTLTADRLLLNPTNVSFPVPDIIERFLAVMPLQCIKTKLLTAHFHRKAFVRITSN